MSLWWRMKREIYPHQMNSFSLLVIIPVGQWNLSWCHWPWARRVSLQKMFVQRYRGVHFLYEFTWNICAQSSPTHNIYSCNNLSNYFFFSKSHYLYFKFSLFFFIRGTTVNMTCYYFQCIQCLSCILFYFFFPGLTSVWKQCWIIYIINTFFNASMYGGKSPGLIILCIG